MVDGEWARSRFKGNELYGKTLGLIGFGRIGQLVARRALAFDMDVVAFDKFVSPERFRELGVTGVDSSEELYQRADLISVHLPKTPETVNWINAGSIAKMKRGVRIVNCARGELIDLDDLEAALESGQVGGAALDVFPGEPLTGHPLFARADVVVTPHLGASTAEAQDRAGIVTAEQIRAALNGGVVTNAVNIVSIRPEAMEALAPFVPLCESLGKLAAEPRRGRDRAGPGRGPGATGGLRCPPARHLGSGRHPSRPHRGAGQSRQRALDGRGAWHRAGRADRQRLRGLHRADHRPARDRSRGRRGCGDRGSGRATSLTWSGSGVRASTSRWPSIWPSFATATSRG